jgi:hypothetical protein
VKWQVITWEQAVFATAVGVVVGCLCWLVTRDVHMVDTMIVLNLATALASRREHEKKLDRCFAAAIMGLVTLALFWWRSGHP